MLAQGVFAAIYLEGYADTTRRYNRFPELNIQKLAGVPSIIFGILGLGIVARAFGLGFTVITAAIVLSLLVFASGHHRDEGRRRSHPMTEEANMISPAHTSARPTVRITVSRAGTDRRRPESLEPGIELAGVSVFYGVYESLLRRLRSGARHNDVDPGEPDHRADRPSGC